MKNCRQRKAFTIVEMVIVIAVIAILATVLVPTIAGIIQRAEHSADQQFVASLNIQLAQWQIGNGQIESESDLRKAIDEYYGDGFYDALEPKSGDQGYHYWFDIQNQQVVLEKYTALISNATAPTAVTPSEFSAASLRNIEIVGKYYFVMDQAGSDLADLLNGFETMGDAQDYEDRIFELEDLLANGGDESGLYTAISNKLKTVTIMTDAGAFRHDPVANIQSIWISPNATALAQTKVFVFNGSTVDDGQNSTVLATEIVTDIELPAGVTIGIDGLSALKVDTYTDADLVRDYANTTRLHVNVETVDELDKIFTDCVLVMPNGAKYIYQGTELYALPVNIATDSSVGSVDGDTITIGDFKINGETTSNPGTGSVFFLVENDETDPTVEIRTQFAAYYKKSVQLSLIGGVTNSMVNWTSSDEALATVDSNGLVTFGALPAFGSHEATITATYKYDSSKTATINLHVVVPTTITYKVGGVTADGNKVFNLSYTGTPTYGITASATYSDGGAYVAAESLTLGYDYDEEGLFGIATNATTGNDELTIVPSKLNNTASEGVTITCTGASGTVYEAVDFTVTVKDDTKIGLKTNKITDTLTIGNSGYLFRVGNANAIKLSTLFSAAEEGKTVEITGVKFYHPTKTGVDGKPVAINWATYTPNATNWENATIKFSDYGVAVIEVTTSVGDAVKLNVEVVDGYNVTKASELQAKANNILLSDIALADGGTFSLTGDANNHKVLYGNGFTFDITKGSITGTGIITLSNADLDNVRILGSAYTDYAATYKENYYSSAVAIGSSARITNSYIFGCRANIIMKGDLEIVNTVLDCARLANLNIENGTLTIDGLTTINQARADTKDKMGMGILVNEDASSGVAIKVKGDLVQYNWMKEGDSNKLPSVTGKTTLVNTIFGATEYLHDIGGTTYANLGIIGMTSSVPLSSVTFQDPYDGKTFTISSVTGFAVSIKDSKYDATAADLKYRDEAYTWIPTTQGNVIPTISWGTYKSDITFEKGQSEKFNPNVLTAAKYGNTLDVTVSMNGVDYTGKEITFTQDGTYTITYQVKDPYVYGTSGNQLEAVTYEYTVTIKVTTTNPEIKAPEFSFVNATGTTTVKNGDKTYVVPTFTDSSKFYKVATVNGKDIYAPVVKLQYKNNTSDFYAYYPIFGGVSITWYDANNTATTYNSTSNLSALPAGLTWITEVASAKGYNAKDGETWKDSWDGYKKYSSFGLCAQSKKIGSQGVQDDDDITVEFSFQAEGSEMYYYYIRFDADAHDCPSCVTPDTLVTLADGTQKEIQYVTYDDMLLVWNFQTGEYDVMPATIVMNHGYADNTVVTLNFSDGTTVKTINGHGFFDVADRKFVILNDANVADYAGREFAKVDGDGYTTVTLDSFSVATEYTESWSILTAEQYNCILENMWTLTPAEVDGSADYLMPFEIGADMKYDEAKMQADIEKYGLYTYEDFAEYCTYEQFVAFGFANFKVSVEKGFITWEEIEFLLDRHLGGTNN